jgi:hypothetical protein
MGGRGAVVKHAGAAALEELDWLIAEIRKVSGLQERKAGCFYRKSKAFLHFHEDPTGLYADVRLDPEGDFVRTRVTTKAEQSKLMRDVRKAALG